MGPAIGAVLFVVIVGLGFTSLAIIFAPSRAALRESGYSLREIRRAFEHAQRGDRLLAEVLGADAALPQLPQGLQTRIETHLQGSREQPPLNQ